MIAQCGFVVKRSKRVREVELGFTILPPLGHPFPPFIKVIMTTDKKKCGKHLMAPILWWKIIFTWWL